MSDALTTHVGPVVVCGPERMLMANMLHMMPEDRLVAWADKIGRSCWPGMCMVGNLRTVTVICFVLSI